MLVCSHSSLALFRSKSVTIANLVTIASMVQSNLTIALWVTIVQLGLKNLLIVLWQLTIQLRMEKIIQLACLVKAASFVQTMVLAISSDIMTLIDALLVHSALWQLGLHIHALVEHMLITLWDSHRWPFKTAPSALNIITVLWRLRADTITLVRLELTVPLDHRGLYFALRGNSVTKLKMQQLA